MEEALKKEHLQTITVAANEVRWIENGKEILVQGQLFDVKEVRREAGRLVLRGLFDETEMALVKQLDAACREKNKNDDFAFAQFFQLLNSGFIQGQEEQFVQQNELTLSFSPPAASLPDGYTNAPFAPPQSTL